MPSASKTTIAGGSATINARTDGRWSYRWRGYNGWHHYHHPIYGWVGSYSSVYGGGGSYSYSSDNPYYYNYSPTYNNYYPYNGSYTYGDSYSSSGSQSDPGASSSSYQPAPSSPAHSNKAAANTDKKTAAVEWRMDMAWRAFKKGDYAEAQRECELAIRLLPEETNLHEFCALCQFAQGKYQDAAATLYEVLAAGPGWDWSTLSSFYTSAQTYTTQLRSLERYVTENPKDAAGHFLLAYHYLALRERDAAVGQLREVIKRQPKDQVSRGILEALS
jgi:tetratricopeptide (TPR) repeat protein